MATVLVVEDDRSMRMLTVARLSGKYNVLTASDGLEALELVRHGGIDLIVADIMMPRMDGYELLDTLRKEGVDTPFLMLTAKETIDSKRLGFELGADDYLTKPFNSEELLWRVAALLRRSGISESRKITVGSITVDSERYAVYSDQEYIELPRREFDLLFQMLSYPGQIFSKRQLMDKVWGIASESGEETVKTHISRLRNKLANIKEFSIVTVKGLGYKVDIADEASKEG
ncbi:MAG: response regulator transcription factor [Anaerotardibacter sp.]